MIDPYFLGITFAFLVSLLSGLYALAAKKAMKGLDDTKAWAISYQFLGGIIYLVPAIIFFKIPLTYTPYIYLLSASLLWALFTILAWASFKHTSVSIRQTLNSSKNIFVLIFAFIILGEIITPNKIIGAIIIILGIGIISYKNLIWKDKGTFLTLGSAASQGGARTLDKFAIPFFSTPVYSALQFFLPAIWVSLTQKKIVKRIKVLVRSHFKWLILISIIGSVSAFFQFESYRLIDVGIAVMIMELGTVFATIGGIIFLGERDKALQKILGSLIVVTGVCVLVF